MKKVLVLTSLALLGFWAGCSDDSSSGASEEPVSSEETASTATHGDSTTIFVYSYDNFLSKKDVLILDDDTTQLSVDKKFAQWNHAVVSDSSKKENDEMPKAGNVIVVWDDVSHIPYYRRVTSAKLDSSRLILDVVEATPVEAVPAGEYELSTQIYYDPAKYDENGEGELDVSGFREDEKNIYHPVVVVKTLPDYNADELGGEIDGEVISENPYDQLFSEKGVLDIREVLQSNFDIELTANKKGIINFDHQFKPGIIDFKDIKNPLGFLDPWEKLADILTDEDARQKAYEKATGKKKPAETKYKAFLRLDTLRAAMNINAHVKVITNWYLKPKFFEFMLYTDIKTEISNIGMGLSASKSDETQLTHFPGVTYVFMLGKIPFPVTIYMNLYMKYKLELRAMFNYNIQYKAHAVDTIGIRWSSDKETDYVHQLYLDEQYNEPKDFADFMAQTQLIADGTAKIGVYARASLLFAGFAGPTFGVGVYPTLKSSVTSQAVFNKQGDWVGLKEKGSIKGTIDVPLEVGGEVRVLGKRIWGKEFEVCKLKTFDLFEHKGDTTITLSTLEYILDN